MTILKARPTLYKGTSMRSRLEALFAQHCDKVGLDWQYEPGCFADETGQYLPDFYVHFEDEGAFVEVKPTKPDALAAINGPMRCIWSSRPGTHLVAIYPKKSHLEGTEWHFVYRSAPHTTWGLICGRLHLDAKVTDSCVEIRGENPRGLRIDLVDDDLFDRAYAQAKPGTPWIGPSLPIPYTDDDFPGSLWRLVGPRTPTDAWFPRTIEVSADHVITDSYSGQSFFMNDLWAKLHRVATTRHPYGG